MFEQISKMLGLDKLDKALSRFEQIKVNVWPDQCLNQRDVKFSCTVCADRCPVDAITLDGGPFLDQDRCTACGICVNVCAPGVFEARQPDEYFLAKCLSALETSGALVFRCSLGEGIEAGQATANQILAPCLGRLHEAVLLGAVALGAKAIWLDTGPCASCGIAWGKRAIAQSVAVSTELMKVFGGDARFYLDSQMPARFQVDADILQRPQSDESAFSRREFLNNVGRQAAVLGLDVYGDRLEKVFQAEKELFNYRVPKKRRLLVAVLRKIGRPSAGETEVTGDVPIGVAQIDRRCTFCDACVLLCPTKALSRVESDAKTGGIVFSAAGCVNCGLCEAICLPGAISFSKKLDPATALSDRPISLIDYQTYECADCGQEFRSAESGSRCPFCRLRATKLADDSWR